MYVCVQLHSQPATTCFGFRRKNKGRSNEPVMWIKNPTMDEGKQQPAPSQRVKPAKSDKQVILCPTLVANW